MKCDSCQNIISNQDTKCSICGKVFNNVQPKKNKTKSTLVLMCIIFTFIIFSGSIFLISPSISNINNNKLALNRSSDERTVLIYMTGSNLETDISLGTQDLNGLDYELTSKNKTHILLMAGGATYWNNSYLDSSKTNIYELTSNGFEVVEENGLLNMGDPSTLSHFLNYGFNKYKSSKYDLIMWDHGGAVDGSNYDDLFKTNDITDNLKLYELTTAFENSPFKEYKLNSVLYRTCLSSTIEVANTLSKYSDYMIASEEITYGTYDTSSVFEFLNKIDSNTDILSYGENYINGYRNTIKESCDKYSLTEGYECERISYSIVDLAKLDLVNNNINTYFDSLNNKLNNNYNLLSKIRASLYQYAATQNTGYDMIDLYELVEMSSLVDPQNKELLESLDDAIIYNYSNDGYSHGLSIYYPYYNNYFLNLYSSLNMPSNYKKYISNFYNKKRSSVFNQTTLSLSDRSFIKSEHGDAEISIDLTDEQVNNFAYGKYIVFVDMGDNLYKPVYASDDIYVSDNKLRANIEGKMIKITDGENSYWLLATEEKLNDKESILTTSGILSKAPVEDLGKFKIDAVELKIKIDEENPNGKLISVNKIINKNNSLEISETKLDIKEYDTLEIANQYYNILDENGNYTSEWKGNGVYVGKSYSVDNFHFEKQDFDKDNKYYATMAYVDVSGNVVWSNLMELK